MYVAAVLAVLLAAVSAAYSMWFQELRVDALVETGEVDFEFVPGTLAYLDACGAPPGYGYSGGNDWNASFYPVKGAEQLDKDVGCTDAMFYDSDGDGDLDTVNVSLVNVYPWYYTRVAFEVRNSGTVPIKIWRVLLNGTYYYELNEHLLEQGVLVDLDGDEQPDVTIWWGDNFGVQLHPGESAGISFHIVVLQPAPESSRLTITIELDAIQWNEYESALPG